MHIKGYFMAKNTLVAEVTFKSVAKSTSFQKYCYIININNIFDLKVSLI